METTQYRSGTTLCILFLQHCQLSSHSSVKSFFFFARLQPDSEDQGAWINLCLGRDSGERKLDPTLNTLFCFDHPLVEQVLEYLVQFVETERRIDYKVGRWIYTLLAFLEQPLNPDTCSCLRSLARTCSVIRADSVMPLCSMQIKINGRSRYVGNKSDQCRFACRRKKSSQKLGFLARVSWSR